MSWWFGLLLTVIGAISFLLSLIILFGVMLLLAAHYYLYRLYECRYECRGDGEDEIDPDEKGENDTVHYLH